MPRTLDDLRDRIAGLARSHDLDAVIVHLNDTYHVEERSNGASLELPGMPRVAALVAAIGDALGERVRDKLLVMHSGDFLSPSWLAQRTRGSVMVDMLCSCRLTHFTLGNHEWDHGGDVLADHLCTMVERGAVPIVSSLAARCREALVGVVNSARTADGAVWVYGLMGEDVEKSINAESVRVAHEPATLEERLRAVSEEVMSAASPPRHLVLLTHCDAKEDAEIVDHFARHGDDFPLTYVLGGHDHDIAHSRWTLSQRVMMTKNWSNCGSLKILLLLKHATTVTGLDDSARFWPGQLKEWGLEDQTLTHRLEVAEKNAWDRQASGISLDDAKRHRFVIDGPKRAEVDLRESTLRGRASPFGTFVAERIRAHFDADVGVINAGAFRADAWTPLPLSERAYLDVFPFPDHLVAVEMPRNETLEFLMAGSKRTNGGFLQVSQPSEAQCSEAVRVAGPAFILVHGGDNLLPKARARVLSEGTLRQALRGHWYGGEARGPVSGGRRALARFVHLANQLAARRAAAASRLDWNALLASLAPRELFEAGRDACAEAGVGVWDLKTLVEMISTDDPVRLAATHWSDVCDVAEYIRPWLAMAFET